MAADALELLRAIHNDLIAAFLEHVDDILKLQQQAVEEIVPDVEERRGLSDEEVQWVLEYLQDDASTFRMLRRHRYISAFAHGALHDSVHQRLHSLRSPDARHANESRTIPLRCLPLALRDSLGRPLAVLRVSKLDFASKTLQSDIVFTLEDMRANIQRINEAYTLGADEDPVLQYTLVVDLDGASVKTIPMDLISWYLNEVQPYFHALIGSTIMINYAWTYSGLWRILRHVLPKSAIAKVVFPTPEELPHLLPAEIVSQVMELSKELVQDAPSIPSTPLLSASLSSSRPPSPSISPASSDVSALVPRGRRERLPKQFHPHNIVLPRFSSESPYFGYPVEIEIESGSGTEIDNETDIPVVAPSAPSAIHSPCHFPHPLTHPHGAPKLHLSHGRRRKRDLARTLCVLLWRRWGRSVGVGVALSALVLALFGLVRFARVAGRGLVAAGRGREALGALQELLGKAWLRVGNAIRWDWTTASRVNLLLLMLSGGWGPLWTGNAT